MGLAFASELTDSFFLFKSIGLGGRKGVTVSFPHEHNLRSLVFGTRLELGPRTLGRRQPPVQKHFPSVPVLPDVCSAGGRAAP